MVVLLRTKQRGFPHDDTLVAIPGFELSGSKEEMVSLYTYSNVLCVDDKNNPTWIGEKGIIDDQEAFSEFNRMGLIPQTGIKPIQL